MLPPCSSIGAAAQFRVRVATVTCVFIAPITLAGLNSLFRLNSSIRLLGAGNLVRLSDSTLRVRRIYLASPRGEMRSRFAAPFLLAVFRLARTFCTFRRELSSLRRTILRRLSVRIVARGRPLCERRRQLELFDAGANADFGFTARGSLTANASGLGFAP